MTIINSSNLSSANIAILNKNTNVQKQQILNTGNFKELEADKVSFAKKINKKKIAVISTAVIATALAILAYAKRGDISNTIFKLKMKTAKCQNINIPNKGYDLSKEADCVGFNINNLASGFSFKRTTDDGIQTAQELIKTKTGENLVNIQNNYVGAFGKTQDGHAYVKVNNRNYNTLEPSLSHIFLISETNEFTPAQKNLLALMHQGKIQSQNSPLGKLEQDILGDNPTRENILDLIAKWSQDIDVNDKSTQKFLSQASSIQKGKCADNISDFVENLETLTCRY